MITIQDVLSPKHTLLDLKATASAAAIYEVADLLRNDERVLDWNTLYQGLKDGNSCIANRSGFGMCIPHARTSAVSAMTMACGRSIAGIPFDPPGILVNYIFVIAVPEAMASDYLRIIGALARIVKSPDIEPALRAATTRQEFRDLLAAGELV